MTAKFGDFLEKSRDDEVSLGNFATITLGAGSTVQTTTDTHGNAGEYRKGDNTIEFNDSSSLTINTGAWVIASGPETTNPIRSGNSIINHGLIKAGATSAIFFENVGTSAGRNSVDNFGTIDARGGTNPTTGDQAIGSFQNVGIVITNDPSLHVQVAEDRGPGLRRVADLTHSLLHCAWPLFGHRDWELPG